MTPIARDYLALHYRWLLVEDEIEEKLADAELARLEPHLSDEDALLVMLEADKVAKSFAWPMNTH